MNALSQLAHVLSDEPAQLPIISTNFAALLDLLQVVVHSQAAAALCETAHMARYGTVDDEAAFVALVEENTRIADGVL